MYDTTVLIVGAGPTGLTLACELARREVPFRIVEASPEPQPGSRGKGVQPRTLEVFDDLGVVEQVLANGRMGMPMRITQVDGTTVVRDDAPPARPDVPYPASVIIPEWRIEQFLRHRLGQLGGAVEFGVEVVDVETSRDGVTTRVADGTTITARWLAGCDGGHSIVRKRSRIDFVGETRQDVRMLVADLRVDTVDEEAGGLDHETWHMWQSEEGLVTLCPLPSTDLFQYQAGIAVGQDPATDLANLQAILRRRSGRDGLRLREPQWRTLWRANVRLAARYRSGGVFLAGDAAHIHSPAGGQGMNTGIQDAYNLGWKLAAVAAGADPALLDSYEAERRPVAAGVLALSDARLRETLVRNAIPVNRSADTTQLGVDYRGSSLARDDRAATARLRAGDRAPDAAGLRTQEGTFRLFDLMRGTGWTLLDWTQSGVSVPAGVRAWRIVAEPARPGEVADEHGWLARSYEPGERTLVLVRPDGYVGLLSDAGTADAVRDYLAGLR